MNNMYCVRFKKKPKDMFELIIKRFNNKYCLFNGENEMYLYSPTDVTKYWHYKFIESLNNRNIALLNSTHSEPFIRKLCLEVLSGNQIEVVLK